MLFLFALQFCADILLYQIKQKLDSHIFDAIAQLRNKKKHPNKITIMTFLLESFSEELNIDNEQFRERLKGLVKYKKLENKQCSGFSSYYNISDDRQSTEPPLGS